MIALSLLIKKLEFGGIKIFAPRFQTTGMGRGRGSYPKGCCLYYTWDMFF